MTYLFLRLLKDDLKEYTYAARLAGLSYGIASGRNAILVSTARQLTHHVWQDKGLGMLTAWYCAELVVHLLSLLMSLSVCKR